MYPENEQPARSFGTVVVTAITVVVLVLLIAGAVGLGQDDNKPISELWQKIDMPALEADLSSRYGETTCDRESDWTFTCTTTSTGHTLFVECSEADDGSCSWRP